MPSRSQESPQWDACTFPTICPSDSTCRECAEIREINVQRIALEERKSAVISRINARRDPLTSKLPPEVVSYIFEEYVRLHPEDSGQSFRPLSKHIQIGTPSHFTSFSPRAPLNLGAVCRQWRSIAWSHPRLWNNIDIDLSLDEHGHGPKIVAEWLARSQSLPLDIRIYDRSDDIGESAKVHRIKTMNVIKQFSSRWRSLDIQTPNSNMVHDLQGSYFSDHQDAPSASLLRHLSLIGDNDALPFEKLLYPSRKWAEACSTTTPLLTNTFRVTLDWTHLSHLHITQTYVRPLRWMLERISEVRSPLVHLTIREMSEGIGNNVHSQWTSSSHSATSLPVLLVLSIRRLSENVLAELLPHLHAPALQSIECDFWGALCVPSFVSFVSQSGCSPREFIISDYDNALTEFIPTLLRALPTLEDLTLSINNSTVQFFCDVFSQKSYRTVDAPILPGLKRLCVETREQVKWSSLVSIYIEDQFVILFPEGETPLPQIPRPGRQSLQLLVCYRVYEEGARPIRVTSLTAIACLWKQHGVRIQALQGDDTGSELDDLLVPSYHRSDCYDATQPEDSIIHSLKQLAALSL